MSVFYKAVVFTLYTFHGKSKFKIIATLSVFLLTREWIYYIMLEVNKRAGVLELADEADSKSVGSDTVRVRPPPPAPKIDNLLQKVVDFPCYLFTVHFRSIFSEVIK